MLLLQEVSSTISFALHFLVIGHEACSILLILKTFLFFQCRVQGLGFDGLYRYIFSSLHRGGDVLASNVNYSFASRLWQLA